MRPAGEEHEMHVLQVYALRLQCWCTMLVCEWLMYHVRMLETWAKIATCAGEVCSVRLAHFPLRKIMNRSGVEEHLEKNDVQHDRE